MVETVAFCYQLTMEDREIYVEAAWIKISIPEAVACRFYKALNSHAFQKAIFVYLFAGDKHVWAGKRLCI